jgi:hypothetical protein
MTSVKPLGQNHVEDANALAAQGDYGGDEETTLPPPSSDEFDLPASPVRPFAFGDFRTYETTFAALGDGAFVEVQLISERGDRAHFGMDRPLAAVVAKELERQLTEANKEERQRSRSRHHDRFLLSARPKLAQLVAPGTGVFWTVDESPSLRVSQHEDRIFLTVRSDEASLGISMQGGVAAAVQRFLARAGRARVTHLDGG